MSPRLTPKPQTMEPDVAAAAADHGDAAAAGASAGQPMAAADASAVVAGDGQGDGHGSSSKQAKDTSILALEDQDKGSKETGRATSSQELVVANDALVDMSGPDGQPRSLSPAVPSQMFSGGSGRITQTPNGSADRLLEEFKTPKDCRTKGGANSSEPPLFSPQDIRRFEEIQAQAPHLYPPCMDSRMSGQNAATAHAHAFAAWMAGFTQPPQPDFSAESTWRLQFAQEMEQSEPC